MIPNNTEPEKGNPMSIFPVEDVILDTGNHKPGEGKGCVMEWVSVKWMMEHRGLTFTEAWAHLTDRPDCTEPMIYRTAQTVNDRLPDDERQRLVPLIDRLMLARRVSAPEKGQRCRVRVACWAARSVLDLVRESDREACERAITAAEAWLRGEATRDECAAGAYAIAADAADAAYAAYAAAAAAAAAADDAATAAGAYAIAAIAAAGDAAAIADATAAATAAADRDLVLWLDELLDQWEKARAEEGVLLEVDSEP